MDQQLKQRLIGVSIIVALSVIFVPMLFDKSEDKGKITASGIPPIPEDVLEKPLELPKTAEELAPKEKSEAPAETGYHIVPLTDEPAPKEPAKAKAKPGEEAAHEESLHIVDPDEEKPKPEPEKPVPAVNKPAGEMGNAAAVKPTNAKPKAGQETKPAKSHPLEVDGDEGELPMPAPAKETAPHTRKPKAHQPGSKPAETLKDEDDLPIPAPNKPETRKPKLHPPGPKPAETVRDEGTTPAPAKPESSTAKPKTAASLKPLAPQHHSAAKTEQTESTEAPAAKPATPTTSTSHPAPAGKPPAGEKAKPAKVEREEHQPPSHWVLQAGSFTNEDKARSLAEKLRQSNPSAHVETVHGANGSFHKVLIGPESERSRVEQIRKRVENETGIKGLISPR
ncbi:MAG: SPOR domain-containing protein [Methylococcaceae bacterium]|nr:SPOR domain-containing protein [Methylococcaceae bacterium]